MSRISLARLALGPRVSATLDYLAVVLQAAGYEVRNLEIPATGLPADLSPEAKRLADLLRAPAALIESWRVARHLDALVRAGEVVVVPDAMGVGGMFALEESTRPDPQRRTVLVSAADSAMLEYLLVAGTVAGVPEGLISTVEWETVGYRSAAGVLATSEVACRLLEPFGIQAQPVGLARQLPTSVPKQLSATVLVAGPVSRIDQTHTILRAIAAVPDINILLSTEDRTDLIWEGSTWEATGGVRALLNGRIRRGWTDNPQAVVVGDPLAIPGASLDRLRASGSRLLVAAGSAAAACYPEAETWENAAQLTRLLSGMPSRAAGRTPAPFRLVPPPPKAPGRARRVSVGVPIFRNVRFLDECIESVLSQTEGVAELILIDDGSNRLEVSEAVAGWVSRRPGLIRSMVQSNQGVCVARNRVLDEMTGDSFVFLDADDTWEPDFIEATATALRQTPWYSAVATWTEFFGDYAAVEAKPPFDREVSQRYNPIISTGVLLDMAVREQGIRFAPDLAFLYCEDWDFWAQVVAAGGRFGLVPRPLVRHRVYPGSGATRRTPLAYAIGKARANARFR